MSEWEIFLKLLEKSVEKNGADMQITLGHLKNMVKLVDTKSSESAGIPDMAIGNEAEWWK